MNEKPVNPVIKQILEMGPVLGFFAAFFLLKDDSYQLFGHAVKPFTLITFWFVIAMVACMGILWCLAGHLSRMQVMTLVVVVFMGALTVAFDSEVFLKLKPTILYLAFAGILAYGLLRGKSHLATLMGEFIPMTHEGWIILTHRFVWFFVALAIGNAIIAYMLSSGVWVATKTFGLPVLMLVFTMTQMFLLQKYMIEPEEESDKD
ncbi:MAG: inner membrane-spanning protein YciB [Octadecabacter sp.]